MREETWGVICMACGEFIPEPENGAIEFAKQVHIERNHNISWHEAVKDEDGEVRKI